MERHNRRVGVFWRETLPCSWSSYATSRLRDMEQPHLSPQHYELSGKQEVLDQTRVLVSKQCTKATSQQAWGKSRCADLTTPHRRDPILIMTKR